MIFEKLNKTPHLLKFSRAVSQAIKTHQNKPKKVKKNFSVTFLVCGGELCRDTNTRYLFMWVLEMQYASICLQGSIKLEKDGKITFEEVLRSLIRND